MDQQLKQTTEQSLISIFKIKKDSQDYEINVPFRKFMPGITENYVKIDGNNLGVIYDMVEISRKTYEKNRFGKLMYVKNKIEPPKFFSKTMTDEAVKTNNIAVIDLNTHPNILHHELINFINQNIHTIAHNNNNHVLSNRAPTKTPVTNFLIPVSKLIKIITCNNSQIQFINMITKISNTKYKISIAGDDYFKDIMILYVKGKDGKMYYVDELMIELDRNKKQLQILGFIGNRQVSENKITDGFLRILIEIMNQNDSCQVDRDILRKYADKYYENTCCGHRFMKEIEKRESSIISELDGYKFLLIRAQFSK